MPPGLTPGTEYVAPSEEELIALEAELAAQEAAAVPSPGLGAGSAYSEPIPPPPAQTAPAGADTYFATEPSAGLPTWDWLAPLGAARDAAIASPVAQAVGGVLGAELPFADQLPPPPTAVGARLAAGDPGGAAQLVGDVAGSDPLTTASFLIGGPLLGGAARLGRAAMGAVQASRGAKAARTAAAATEAAAAARTAEVARRAANLAAGRHPLYDEPVSMGRELTKLAGTVAAIPIAVTAAGMPIHRGLEALLGTPASPPYVAPSAGANAYETGAEWFDAQLLAALGLSPSGATPSGAGSPASSAPAWAAAAPTVPVRGGASGSGTVRATVPTTPAASTTPAAPASAPISTASTVPATAPAPVVSTPARPSPPASAPDENAFLSMLGLANVIELTSPEPFSTSDFTGRLGNLPELRNVTPDLARRMAEIANGKLRKLRGKRAFPFSLERRDFDALIRESVTQALREAGMTITPRSQARRQSSGTPRRSSR